MKEYGDEVDRAAAQAWVRFQARLADRLAAMEQDDVLVVEALVGDDDQPGAAPYVQFCAWGPGLLRGEVASNHVLMPLRELDAEGERALVELGYDAPTYDPDQEPDGDPDEEADGGSLNFFVDVEQTEADRLAVMSVRALRDVFGVADPALLTGDLADGGIVPSEPAAFERGDEPVAAYPEGGHEELTVLVDRALTSYFGHEPRHDDDGDIPVDLGGNVLFVRVHESVPVVELFACVVSDVQDLERAAFEVNVLNRDVRFVKFRLTGDAIMAELHLPSWPFVPEHLRAMLAVMTDSIQQLEGDLLQRVGGSRPLDVASESDGDDEPADGDDLLVGSEGCTGDAGPDVTSAWQLAERVLVQLDADSAGSVTPELAAGVCGHDVELILHLIDREESQARAWKQSREAFEEAGDDQGVGGAEAEMAYSRRTIRLLRRALRVVVERQAARDDVEPPKPSVTRRRHPSRPPRPRRVPDPTIEEVDPEIWT